MTKSFKGRLMGVEYESPTLFEQTARALGFRRGKGRATRTWKPGTPVAVVIAGQRVEGQVWSEANRQGYVWVALNSGKYVAVFTRMTTPFVYETPGGKTLGRVA